MSKWMCNYVIQFDMDGALGNGKLGYALNI